MRVVALVLVVAAVGTAGGSPRGSLEGVVRFAGATAPPPTRVANTTDPDVCGELQTLEDLLVAEDGRGIRHVIVALVDVPPAHIPQLEAARLVIDNRDCRFVPHVAVLTVGSVIVATNSDSVLHNTHLYGAASANIVLPVPGLRVSRRVPRPGMVMVKCDVHGWMQAYIRVDEHPFHAVTDSHGRFRIPDVPAGTYAVEFWHEKLGRQRQTVEVRGGRTTRVEVTYPLDGAENSQRRER